MSYAIFRSQPIYKLADLAQIGSHNKRDKKAYKSNPDIKLELSKNNINLVECPKKYLQQFYELTKEYKNEHDLKMKNMRSDRIRTFNQMLDDGKNVVADEMLFTSDNDFFKNMNNNEIKKWANTCMDFVYQDMGYTKEQILHSTIHLDEKTPHLHVVVVPLIRKFDKRTNCEKYTITKKHYIKDKDHLSQLQDKYYDRLIKAGFDLERGIKNSDNEHLTIKEYKKITYKLDKRIEKGNYLLNRDFELLEDNFNKSKPTKIGNMIKIDSNTYDTLKTFMNTAKNVINDQPKNQALFKELKEYTSTYKDLQNENRNIKYEVNQLKQKNESLQQENKQLHNFIYKILQSLKDFFKRILQIGTEKEKDTIFNEITDYYDKNLYDKDDLIYISKDTTKEEKILDYVNTSKNYKPYDDYNL